MSSGIGTLIIVTVTACCCAMIAPADEPPGSPADRSVVPVQAVRVADDDGRRRTLVTPTQVAEWVAFANATYAIGGIVFSFDPVNDFADLNNTLINNITDVGDANWRIARAHANRVAAGYPGKLVVFFRWGSGSSPNSGGFSWWDYNFVAAPGFATYVCSHQNIGLLAHEFGHYLGLPHPFAGTFASVAQAADSYVANGRNPLIFDGDGIPDTLPDPFIWPLQCNDPDHVVLAGDAFALQTNNIMTYWDAPTKTLTPGQLERVNWLLELRQQFNMAMPTNYATPNAREFDALEVIAASNINYGRQDMMGFGIDQWAQNDHLFCGAGSSGWISFRVTVPSADTYQLDLYATRAPDFGIVGVWWDGNRVGGDVDLYAPLVIPTDELFLGTVMALAGDHLLNVAVLGRNPASTHSFFGLDAVTVEPAGCECDTVPGGCQLGAGFLGTCMTGPDVPLGSAVPGCGELCGSVFDSDGDLDVDMVDVSVAMRLIGP